MNHRDIKGGEMVTDNDTMFFYYDGQLLGKCSADYAECDAFLELMQNNSDVATGVLNYMNSLGDPVFPVSDDDWGIAETDIRNVDIYDLYDAFMQELNYQYSDWGEVYVDQIPGVEIWASESSTVAASTNPKYFANMVSASIEDDTDYTYYVAGYYDNLMRGLADSMTTDSFDAVLNYANELANDGYFIEIKNVLTGNAQYYDANVWLDAIDTGDVPEEVFELTM